VPPLASFQLVRERLDPSQSIAEFLATHHRASGPEGSLLTLVCQVSERTPEEVGLPLVYHNGIIWLSRRRKQQQDPRSEDREIAFQPGCARNAEGRKDTRIRPLIRHGIFMSFLRVTFNAIEKLYAKPVELIGAD